MIQETKSCQNCKSDFTIETDDFIFYQKINVPPPTFCWKCRAIRRMAFRNMRHLFPRTCAGTGEKIYTLVPSDNPMPVYGNKYWYSDKWDALDYGRSYDFSRPFFEQFRELYNTVPWGIMWSMEMKDCEYCVSGYSKNCYFCFDSGYDEDSAYNVTLLYSKHCFDGLNVKDCEYCYYCINTNQSYKTFFSRNCTSCVEVWFSQDCVGCTNCFGCSGLRNKSYYIFNQPYDKETYEAKLKQMKLHTWEGLRIARRYSEALWLKSPVKYQHGVQAPNSSGDYLYNGSELVNCFFVGNARNLRNCQSVIYPPNNDGIDITSSEGTELCYEIIACGNGVHRALGCMECVNVSDTYYSINSKQVTNVFGCAGLRSNEYCILNKKYTKEEYFELLPKIKKHMDEMPYIDKKGRVYKFGDFFPFDMATHGYSQSQAFEYFPTTETEAKEKGYRWRIPEPRNYTVTLQSKNIPNDINDVSDEILKEVIQCEHEETKDHSFGCDVDCATAFRITKQELDFYKHMKLPLPRLCFNCRHIDRIKWRNVPALYHRICMNEGCINEFETSYAPDRPEIVYCESCYQKVIF